MNKVQGSTYKELKKKFKKLKCIDCEGSGKQDDADLGDMYYNEWTCETCKGTGLKPNE